MWVIIRLFCLECKLLSIEIWTPCRFLYQRLILFLSIESLVDCSEEKKTRTLLIGCDQDLSSNHLHYSVLFYFHYLSQLDPFLRAKRYPIVGSTRASESTCWVVFRVTISIGAPLFEEPREICWAAASWITTVLVYFKNGAWIVTPTGRP